MIATDMTTLVQWGDLVIRINLNLICFLVIGFLLFAAKGYND